MSSGIYSALSGAIAQQTALEVTATNLANASTKGYRAIRPVFHELLGRAQGEAFTAVRQTSIDTSLGRLKQTGNPLDLALPRNAFLAVETPAGERYTRSGSLKIAPNGVLTTQSGHPVLSENRQRITLDGEGRIEIADSGEVSLNGEATSFLRVVTFADPRQMTYEGEGLLNPNAEAGNPEANTEALQIGIVEESNASPVRAMTDLIMATRMSDAMQRAMTTFKRVDNRMLRTVAR